MENTLVISSLLLWVMVLLNMLLTLGLARRMRAFLPKMGKFLKVGQKAPDFTAQTLQGEKVSLARYARQSAAFVFLSPSCRPCREELPRLQALWSKARQSGVELVLVSDADEEKTRPFVEGAIDGLPVLIAPREHNSFFSDYKVIGTPSYYLIDARGSIQAAGISLSEMEEKIEAFSQVRKGGDGMEGEGY